MQRVGDAVAASGTDDHIVFLEHPSCPSTGGPAAGKRPADRRRAVRRDALEARRPRPMPPRLTHLHPWAPPWRTPKSFSELPEELELFARIEGLVGEEAVLLATAPEQRKDHERERLRAIAEELDRIWERLRERAEWLAGHCRYETAESHPDGS